jgi:hypothetical protein
MSIHQIWLWEYRYPVKTASRLRRQGSVLYRMLVLTDVLAGGLKKNRNSALLHTIAQVCPAVKYLH